MREWSFDQSLRQRRDSLIQGGYGAYCLFGMSRSEIKLADELNLIYEDCLALPFLRVLHRSRNGVRYLEQDILLKGYVFLYIPEHKPITDVRMAQTAFRILGTNRDQVMGLSGEDKRYAEWVLNNGGIIGVSKALREGDRVKIIDGPLLSVEGCITEYSKKNRNCRVQINMAGNSISAWLPFEWVENDADRDNKRYAPPTDGGANQ